MNMGSWSPFRPFLSSFLLQVLCWSFRSYRCYTTIRIDRDGFRLANIPYVSPAKSPVRISQEYSRTVGHLYLIFPSWTCVLLRMTGRNCQASSNAHTITVIVLLNSSTLISDKVPLLLWYSLRYKITAIIKKMDRFWAQVETQCYFQHARPDQMTTIAIVRRLPSFVPYRHWIFNSTPRCSKTKLLFSQRIRYRYRACHRCGWSFIVDKADQYGDCLDHLILQFQYL